MTKDNNKHNFKARERKTNNKITKFTTWKRST
jgi:hypothetical protein